MTSLPYDVNFRKRRMRWIRLCHYGTRLVLVVSVMLTMVPLFLSLSQPGSDSLPVYMSNTLNASSIFSGNHEMLHRGNTHRHLDVAALNKPVVIETNIRLQNGEQSQTNPASQIQQLKYAGVENATIESASDLQRTLVPVSKMPESAQKVLTSKGFHDMPYIQWRRRSQVQQVCRRTGPWSADDLAPTGLYFLLADDNHKVIYCNTPKVASTMWIRTMLQLNQSFNQSFAGTSWPDVKVSDRDLLKRHGLVYLDTLSHDEAWGRIAKYYKFMFVRPPFERLLAVYNDKLGAQGKQFYQGLYGTDIVKQYRKRQDGGYDVTGSVPTFAEFANYIGDLDKSRGHFDEHWMSYYKLCHPCVIKYDFIGKLETMALDRAYVLSNGFRVQQPQSLDHSPKTTNTMVRSAFDKLPSEIIEKLADVYHLDFSMFNYTLKL